MFKPVFKLLSALLNSKGIYLTKSINYLHRTKAIELNRFDFVRVSTLELVAFEINTKKVQGDVAELGVYKGDFSKDINTVFPDRNLYLFDTFQGFDTRDTQKEKSNKYSTGDQDFSDTSVELVLSKMPNPKNCIVKKGYFPETATGVDGKFCFVSLDADLYEPIYEGLKFFYPKLQKGGYIFIHDFNNDEYKGAREAVVQFCNENYISYTPIPDGCGTAIIAK